MTYKGVLFDLDGTLLNTLPDLTFISNITMEEAGFPTHTEEEVKWYIGNGVELLFSRSLPKDANLSEEEYQALFQKMRENYLTYQNRLTRAYEGIDEMLKELKAMGVKSAIVTNKMDKAAKEVQEKYFPGLIDVSVGARPDLRLKPWPDQGLEALKAMGLDASECIYVGDSDTDIETGRMLNMPAIGCAWGFRGEEFLKEHGAAHIARKPSDIVDFVKYTEIL